MWVESLGLPGSGKSTLVSACIAALEKMDEKALTARGLQQLDDIQGRGYPRFCTKTRLRQSFLIAEYLSSHGQMHNFLQSHYASNIRNLALGLAAGANVMRYRRNRERLHSYWADEGFLHLGSYAMLVSTNWNFFECEKHIERFISVLPKPDVVIYTKATAETATKAIFQRASQHGRNEESTNRRYETVFGGKQGMKTREKLIDLIKGHLEQAGVNLITVKAHENLEDTAKMVLTACQASPIAGK